MRSLFPAPLLTLVIPLLALSGCSRHAQTVPAPQETATQPASCASQSDCPEGTECIGPEGCGVAWNCLPTLERPCTLDLAPYCGCDGETFHASSSCPDRPFASRGACEPEAAGTAPQVCDENTPCPDGLECQGPEGCDAAWTCGPPRRCARARMSYCGCDGETFVANGNCPRRRYSHRGACDGQPARSPSAPHEPATPPSTSAQAPEPAPAAIPCTSSEQCPEGTRCWGPEGCGVEWRCLPSKEVPCVQRSTTFCGCDGTTFRANLNCPDRQFAHRGPCSITPPGPMPSPYVCNENTPCPEGLECQGPEGCGLAWVCGPPRRCTRDLVAFCGCDGQTFRGSSTCPARPFAHRGECP